MKPLVIITAIVIVHANIFGNLYYFFPAIIQWGLDEFPNLTCSLTVHEFFSVLLSYFFKAILVFKALAALSPADYLSMDHFKIWKVTFAAIMGLWITEYTFVLANYSTMCTEQNIDNLQDFHNMSVNADIMEKKPATFFMHTAAILGLRMMLYLLIILKKRSVVNKIHPYVRNFFPRSVVNERPETMSFAVFETHVESNNVEVNVIALESVDASTIENLDKDISFAEETATREISDIDANQTEQQPNNFTVAEPLKESLENIDGLESVQVVPNTNNTNRSNTVAYSADLNTVRIIINTPNSHNIENNNDAVDVREPQIANFKNLLLNTDIAIWISTIGLVLAIFSVFINKDNKGVIVVHLMVGRIFFLALPIYWILRSEDKILFAQRRLKRIFNWHHDNHM